MDPLRQVGLQANQPRASVDKAAGQGIERLQETTRELEGVFLGLLMKAMRSTVGNGGLFKNGPDSQTYREMFDQEVARSMARAGGIGLGQMVLRDQLRRQAAAESGEAKKTSQVLSPGDR
jgi:peptidoglycan hydrolase FlgJ